MIGHLSHFVKTPATRTIGVGFLIHSIIFGNWITRIPDVKYSIGLTDAELGTALLFSPVGALVIIPLADGINRRFGIGRVTLAATVLAILSLILLASAQSFFMLAAALFYFGLTNVLLGMCINSVAAVTERNMARSIMNTSHGMWSLGAMLGSGMGSLIVGTGISVWSHFIWITALLLIMMGTQVHQMLAFHEDLTTTRRKLKFPSLGLIGMAFICFCILICEGAIADWSALYMSESLESSPFLIGLAYASYSLIMAAGRFSGDALIPKIGKKPIVVFGSLIAFISLGITLMVGDPFLAILGFGLTGLGYSCIVPAVFTSAANEPGYSATGGLAIVTIIGYVGFMVGPPFIGYLSDLFTLPFALGLVVILSLMVTLTSSVIKFN